MFMLIGYFSIFILLVVLGIIFPKAGWVFYGIGTALTLMSLLGGSVPIIYWIVFIVLAVIGACLIAERRN